MAYSNKITLSNSSSHEMFSPTRKLMQRIINSRLHDHTRLSIYHTNVASNATVLEFSKETKIV